MAEEKQTVIAEGYEGYVPPKPPPVATQLSPEQELARNAGAGFVSDLLKMSGGDFALTDEQARDAGAGFIGDLLRAREQAAPPEPVPPDPELKPVLDSINPNTAVIGGADLTMHVHGSKFVDGSVIVFNGGDEPTTFITESSISTTVKPSTASTPGDFPVWVRNPDGQRTDAEKTFAFTDTTVEAR